MELAPTLGSGLSESGLSELALLPLEIRKFDDGAIAGRTVLRSLDRDLASLGEGEWVVTMTLPSGQHLPTIMKVDSTGQVDTGDLVGRLASSAQSIATDSVPFARIGGAGNQSWMERLPRTLRDIDWSGLIGNVAVLAVDKAVSTVSGSQASPSPTRPTLRYGPERSLRHPNAKLSFFKGSILGDSIAEIAPTDLKIETADGSMSISYPWPGQLIITLLRPDQPPNNLLLPPAATLRLSLQKQDSSEAILVTIGFGDAFTDQAVSLRARNGLYDLTTIAENLTMEDIGDFGAKPTGAAVCLLYLMLNTRDSSSVELALRSLSDEANKSPDAVLIDAEIKARSGQIEAAVQGFLEAAARGLPWFGRGLSILVDRLGLYYKMTRTRHAESGEPARPDLPAKTVDAVEAALDRIRPFAANAIYSAPVTTYTGQHPQHPGSASMTRTEFLNTSGFPIFLS